MDLLIFVDLAKKFNRIYSSTQKRINMKKFSLNCLVDINHTLADIYSGIFCYIKRFQISTASSMAPGSTITPF